MSDLDGFRRFVERGVRNPGCSPWINSDGSLPTDLIDGEVVERDVYYGPWRVVDRLGPVGERSSE